MDAGGSQFVSEHLCSTDHSCIEDDIASDDDDKENVGNEATSIAREDERTDVDDEFLGMMSEREKRIDQSSAVDSSWEKCARLDAFSWILKTQDKLSFRLQTAYLSMMYFDRFLSKRSIDSDSSWAFRLLSIACLSLAAKMEEVTVPSLELYQSEDYNFGTDSIQRMELLVLSTLEWKMICISPFSFCSHFRSKLCEKSEQKDWEFNIPAFILSLAREVNLTAYRPSTMAAAAILAAMDQSLTRQGLETKMNPIIQSGFIDCEDVFKCYELMKKVGMEDFTREFSLKSAKSGLRTRNNTDASSALSKRRRLDFSSRR